MEKKILRLFIVFLLLCVTTSYVPSIAFAAGEATNDQAVTLENPVNGDVAEENNEAVSAPETADAPATEVTPQPSDTAKDSTDKSVTTDTNTEKVNKADAAEKTETAADKEDAAEEKADADEEGKYLPYVRGNWTEDPIAALEREKFEALGDFSEPRLYAGSKKGLTPGEKVTYQSKEIDEASIFTAGGLSGFCGDIGQPRGDNRQAEVSVLKNDSKAARVMYYYCVKKNWFEKAKGEDKGERQSSLNGMYRMVFLERMVQYAYQGSKATNYMSKYYADSTVDLIKEKAKVALDKCDEAPSGFKAYLLKDSNSKVQSEILMWDFEESGSLMVKKVPEKPTNLSLAGAVYYVYTDKECTKRAKNLKNKDIKLVTDEDGETAEVEVELGTYYVKEQPPAPNGFELDTNVYTAKVNENKLVKVTSKEPVTPPPTYVYLQKKAAATTTDFIKEAPVSYTLQGAVYGIYDDSTKAKAATAANPGSPIAKVTTKADGTTDLVKVESGKTYYAKELTASKGFRLDPNVNDVTVTADNIKSNPAKFTSVETPAYAYPKMNIVKIAKNGESGWKRMLDAEYTLKYYAVDPNTAVSKLPASPTRSWVFKTVEMTNELGRTEAGFDLEQHEPISGSPLYMVGENRVLPIGVFTITEKEAPAGFSVDKNVYAGKVYQPSNSADAVITFEGKDKLQVEHKEQIVEEEDQHAVIQVNKVDKETGKALPQGVAREITKGSLAGAEYDVIYCGELLQADEKVGTIVTDENGFGELKVNEKTGEPLKLGHYIVKESKASPGYILDREEHKVLARTQLIKSDYVYVVAKSLETPHHTYVSKKDITTNEELPGAKLQVLNSAGEIVEEWVSTNEPHDIVALHDETQGKLKDGKYILREITAPFGYDTAEDVEFEVKSGKAENKVEMKNAPISILTTATDSETKTHTGTFSKEEKIIDSVQFKNLYAGREYTFKGVLMDKETNQPLKDKDGKEVTAERTCKFDEKGNILEGEYTGPKGALISGSVDLEFIVDASAFTKDKETVVFEDLEREGKKIATHANIEDKSQTVKHGGIVRTIAVDKNSKSHNVLADKNTVIIDTVEYQNLVEGETYTVDGVIFDKTTNALTKIVGTTTFVAKEENGKVEVEFKFDASEMKNHDLVVFETLKSNGVEISKHEEPNDENQTVHVPEIKTTATDVNTNDHIAYGGEDVQIKDVVVYTNLIPGKEYEMSGTLMSKATGKPIMSNGEKVTATKKFTPTEKDGSVELIFSFDGTELRGETVVAFEECKTTNIPIAVHADINDKEQSVNIPKIETEANLSKSDKVVEDLVTYENLKPGKYIMRGYLVDKKSEKTLKESQGETEFEILEGDETSGEVTVTLPVKEIKKLGGYELVAFEELYYECTDENGNVTEELVCDHMDIEDESQTVEIPGGTPKTGDSTAFIYYAFTAIAAMIVLSVVLIRKRTKANK